MLAQRMRDLMAHDGRDLVVLQLELFENAVIEGDLAARHAKRVELGVAKQVDLPFPLPCAVVPFVAERDDALGDVAQPLQLRMLHRRERALLRSLLHHLRVLLGAGALDVIGRDQAGELALRADVHALAGPGRQQRGGTAGSQQPGEQAPAALAGRDAAAGGAACTCREAARRRCELQVVADLEVKGVHEPALCVGGDAPGREPVTPKWRQSAHGLPAIPRCARHVRHRRHHRHRARAGRQPRRPDRQLVQFGFAGAAAGAVEPGPARRLAAGVLAGHALRDQHPRGRSERPGPALCDARHRPLRRRVLA
mmetsp:Transcript_54684/g.129235  ORF Transcript_54684/g.129235 Transcript_54684/m.129235 type:complete len:310 (-) Transcript_54684:1187-2116(-)